MAVSTQYKAILNLGKKLVDEFGPDQRVDTLSRWMAHYIAELIDDAENAAPEDKPFKEERCAAAILDLWRHRAELPDGTRPFEDFEPIFRTIASLDPGDETSWYFAVQRAAAADVEPDTKAGEWLKHASGIDSTAKELIRHCLARAAQSAYDQTEEWVILAEEAGLGNEFDVRGLRLLIVEASSGEAELKNAEGTQIEKRIERLEAFQELASGLAADLRRRIAAEE
jgi:hypothetical protein